MPRFASRSRVAELAFSLPYVWTYEVVPGARLRGRAQAGARVLAALPFAEWGRTHVYRAWTQAGSDGRWELVLPFPSRYRTATLQVPGEWAISEEGSAPVAVHVPEAAVREGRVVEAGVLPAAQAGASREASGAVVQ